MMKILFFDVGDLGRIITRDKGINLYKNRWIFSFSLSGFLQNKEKPVNCFCEKAHPIISFGLFKLLQEPRFERLVDLPYKGFLFYKCFSNHKIDN